MAAEAKYTAAKAVLEQQQQLLDEVVEKNKEAAAATSLAEQRQAKAEQDKARAEQLRAARFAQQRTLDNRVREEYLHHNSGPSKSLSLLSFPFCRFACVAGHLPN